MDSYGAAIAHDFFRFKEGIDVGFGDEYLLASPVPACPSRRPLANIISGCGEISLSA